MVNSKDSGRSPSGSGHSPKGGAASASPAKPSVPNAKRRLPRVHGYQLTEEQVIFGLSAMGGSFSLCRVYEAMRKAGVPESGPWRRGSYGTNTAYAAAIELKKIAAAEGLIQRVGYHSWRSRRRLASAIEARRAVNAEGGAVACDESAVPNGETPK